MCKSSNHQTDDYPTIPAIKKFLNGQPSEFQLHHSEEIFSFNQSQREDSYLLSYDPNLYTDYPSSYDHLNYPWSNDFAFQFHELFPSPPHQFKLEQRVRFDVYQPLYEKSLEDTLQEFMKGKNVLNE